MSRWIDIDDISLLKTVSVGDLSAKAFFSLADTQKMMSGIALMEKERASDV